MTSKIFEVDVYAALCECATFSVNGIDWADYEDFGVKFDRDSDNAPDYCCGDMRFTRHTDRDKIVKCLVKYGITMEQFNEICDVLEDKLSFGSCGWCE